MSGNATSVKVAKKTLKLLNPLTNNKTTLVTQMKLEANFTHNEKNSFLCSSFIKMFPQCIIWKK